MMTLGLSSLLIIYHHHRLIIQAFLPFVALTPDEMVVTSGSLWFPETENKGTLFTRPKAFIEHELMLCSNLRCHLIHNCQMRFWSLLCYFFRLGWGETPRYLIFSPFTAELSYSCATKSDLDVQRTHLYILETAVTTWALTIRANL